MTGWAQINGYRGDTSIEKRIEYDLYYIENWTMVFDMKILILTIFKGFLTEDEDRCDHTGLQTDKKNCIKVLYRLCRQTHLPEQIILFYTRDGIKLDVSVCKDRVSVTEIPILEKNLIMEEPESRGIWMSDADIVVMMTQDAVPADPFLLEKLSEVLNEHPDAVAAYARQIPDQNCGLLENMREFSIIPKSQIKSQKDLPKLGIKTYFCSNVCAAYRRGVYLELGGFPHPGHLQ